MSLTELSSPLVNWPLFLLTSLIIIARTYAPMICSWILEKSKSPSKTINQLTEELKSITNELKTISQQDQFAQYTRKERQRIALVQRIKDEKTNSEIKQKNVLTYFRLIVNIGTVLIMIFLSITGQKHQSRPLFNLPFFRFPLLLWIIALHTFINIIPQIYFRYQAKKTNQD